MLINSLNVCVREIAGDIINTWIQWIILYKTLKSINSRSQTSEIYAF